MLSLGLDLKQAERCPLGRAEGEGKLAEPSCQWTLPFDPTPPWLPNLSQCLPLLWRHLSGSLGLVVYNPTQSYCQIPAPYPQLSLRAAVHSDVQLGTLSAGPVHVEAWGQH